MSNSLELDNGIGLAAVIKAHRLKVPLNQREYSWDQSNVLDLLQDVAAAMQRGSPQYFLGTIVLTKSKGETEVFEVADGQQRLATATVLLSVIRDAFLALDEEKRAQSIERDFLFDIDIDTSEEVAKLQLNADDNHFFYNRILRRPKERVYLPETRRSNTRIVDAYRTAETFFRELQSHHGKQFVNTMLQWRNYLLTGARVIALKVPDSMNAFVMFETLNDRGVKTSQADLVKNHLFEQSGKRLDEAQKCWSAMRGVIESIGEDDDILMEFLRWACCVMYGMTREKDVFDTIQSRSTGPLNAVTFVAALQGMADDYAAIFNPEHPKWNEYKPDVREAIKTLLTLDVQQMRPLFLAIAMKFSKTNVLAAFKGLVSWSVRLTVAGGSAAGRLDRFYAELAHAVYSGKVKNYADLVAEGGNKIPTDAQFASVFETLRVKVAKTARYYLRSLERTQQNIPNPAWIPNDNPGVINLEHVMPQTACDGWSKITEQDIETHANRLGNLALIEMTENSKIDRSPFKEKKPVLAKATYQLTSMIGKDFSEWGPSEIEKRQKKLAELAVKTWPLQS